MHLVLLAQLFSRLFLQLQLLCCRQGTLELAVDPARLSYVFILNPVEAGVHQDGNSSARQQQT